MSGTFTLEKQYQYGSNTNVISTLNTSAAPSLVLNEDYQFSMFAIDEENWAIQKIDKIFTAQ